MPDKKTFYKACQRNKYYMPSYKSSLTCLKYMRRIRSKRYWCPKMDEVHPHICVDAPKKEEVIAYLIAFANDAGKNLGITNKR